MCDNFCPDTKLVKEKTLHYKSCTHTKSDQSPVITSEHSFVLSLNWFCATSFTSKGNTKDICFSEQKQLFNFVLGRM